MAITNNIEADVKIKCIEANTTQQQLGKSIGSTGQYISRLIKNKEGILNKTFVKALETLGYDITLTYTPRSKSATLDELLDD